MSEVNKREKISGLSGAKQMPAYFRKPLLGHYLPVVWPGFLNTSYYHKSLKAKYISDNIIGQPIEAISGRAEYGHALIFGEMIGGGFVYPFHSMGDIKKINMPPKPWIDGVHGFAWLRDLQAVGTAEANKVAQKLTDEWFNFYSKYDKEAWAPQVLARRIMNIFGAWSFAHDNMDAPFRFRIRLNLYIQATHLERRIHMVKNPEHRMSCICGILWASLHLKGWEDRLPAATSMLLYEINRQILPDGGHISRSPQVSLVLLSDLVDLAQNLSYNQRQVPPEIGAAIERISSFIRSMRHEDGGMALFHDTLENQSLHIDTILARSRVNSQNIALFKDTGFASLKAKKTTVIMDLTKPTIATHHICASPMAFEFSSHGQRIIVNAGSESETNLPGSDIRREILKSTRAHSTLSVGQGNATMHNIKSGQPDYRIEGDRQAITASHNGWEKQGWSHKRSLWLSSDGNELMGQDILEPIKEGVAGKTPVILRFHLHPNIKAEYMDNQNSIILHLADGQKWYFDIAEGKLSLGRGTWMGRPNNMRDIQSIIVPASVHDGNICIDWRFYHLS